MYAEDKRLQGFRKALLEDEARPATVRRYVTVAESFLRWQAGRPITKQSVLEWKGTLRGSPGTINVACAAVNRFLRSCGHGDITLKYCRVQHTGYRSAERELTREEYARLVEAAERTGRERLARAIETICATGIRVSELPYVTAEMLRVGETDICNKGKYRRIMLPGKLVKKLKSFCRRSGIRSGPVFVTRTGRPLSRTQLWEEMKALCAEAGVEPSKVFPHNLRHLIAVTYYRCHRDIVKLADILGHSSVNTTRLYLLESGQEHRRELDVLELVLRRRQRAY